MNLAKAYAVSLLGLSGTIVEVEADISANLPNFVLVGLPDASLSESTARVRAACSNSGFPLPSKKITVNLSPASVPKSGSSFDLAISISILAAQQTAIASSVAACVHLGEIGLDGSVRPVSGVIPVLLAAMANGFTVAIVPMGNLAEASLVEGIQVFGCANLAALVDFHLGNQQALQSAVCSAEVPRSTAPELLDLDQVHGQEQAVRALQVAAVGGHHMSMLGTPGSGKTMLAERFAGILPNLTPQQALEVSAVESVHSGNLGHIDGLNLRPRFQSPHHTSSVTSIVGGGSGLPRPGAVSLANHGVLFFDEALEFQVPVLESLREPLESGRVMIHRSAGSAIFPAKFQLILAANPCSCGNFGSVKRRCECTYVARRKYLSKLSGPLLDRIDIRLKIEPVSRLGSKLAAAGSLGQITSTATARARVLEARQRSAARLGPLGYQTNSQVPGAILRGEMSPRGTELRVLERALDAGQLSMRGFDRCLRLAWSIADLEGQSSPSEKHITQALELRGADQMEDLA